MPTTRSGTTSGRASASARNEVIKMLKEDHKQARKCFSDFEKLDPHEDSEQCQALVQQTCAEVEVHAALEEELFYPAARSVLEEEELIDEAEVEHMTARTLIERLKDMAPEEEKFGATFKVLGEYLQHHMKEEEESMFPALSRAKLDWDDLLQRMTARREELMAQFMPAAGGTKKAASAKGKTAPKEKEKGKGRRQPQTEEVEEIEEVEEMADGGMEQFPYVEPPEDER